MVFIPPFIRSFIRPKGIASRGPRRASPPAQVLILCALCALPGEAFSQVQPPQSAGPAAPQKKVSPGPAESKPAEAPGVLVQLNGALETLAAKVSPAVVQILVTGYGPLRERDDQRSQTAFIVRQHAVGSGV